MWVVLDVRDNFFLFSLDINWWTGVVWFTCGLLWCLYQLFGLSFWRHPFTAEDPLVSKWWNAKFIQIHSHEETNSSTSSFLAIALPYQIACMDYVKLKSGQTTPFRENMQKQNYFKQTRNTYLESKQAKFWYMLTSKRS